MSEVTTAEVQLALDVAEAERKADTLRCRYDDCRHPLARKNEQVTCPHCRAWLGLEPVINDGPDLDAAIKASEEYDAEDDAENDAENDAEVLCEECGEPVVRDASEGVWIHGSEDPPTEADYDRNEDHGARPPGSMSEVTTAEVQLALDVAEAERKADTLRCRYDDCRHPLARKNEQVTCPHCRAWLGLEPVINDGPDLDAAIKASEEYDAEDEPPSVEPPNIVAYPRVQHNRWEVRMAVGTDGRLRVFVEDTRDPCRSYRTYKLSRSGKLIPSRARGKESP